MSVDYNKFEKPQMIYDFIQKCSNVGHKVVITCVDRTYQMQTALFAQGREKLEVTNAYRKISGLWLIDEEENKRIVTWTMNSEHVINLDDARKDNDLSRAIDFGILDINGKIRWDVKQDVNGDGISDYRECAMIGEGLGFWSGMRFKTPDWPHLQLKEIKG
jgi:hypothetical protein